MAPAAPGIHRYLASEKNSEADSFVRRNRQAKVKTRTYGFGLGKFGLSYVERDVEFDPDNLLDKARQFRDSNQKRAFDSEFDVARVRRDLAASVSPSDIPKQNQTSAHTLRQGLAAYANSAKENLTAPLPGSMFLGIV